MFEILEEHMKYTIKRPEMMDKIEAARYKPNVIIAILILMAVYAAYFLFSFIATVIYLIATMAQSPGILQGSFNEIFQNLMEMLTSQDATLFSFYLMAIFILFIIIEVRFIEKRPLCTIGLSRKRFLLKYIIGFGVGALLLAVHVLPDFIANWSNIVFIGFKPAVILFLIAFIIQTACEEVMFRGYLLTAFGNKIGMLWAVMLSSLLFALMHIFNGDMTVLSGINLFAIGALLGFYVIRTNNIWGAFGIHAAWNFLQGLFVNMDIGPLAFDYSVVSIGGEDFSPQNIGILGDPASLISIVIFAAAIACVLFIGKNRIVVLKERHVDNDIDAQI
jgi:membrane protease YdiL (CAAX protease family)